MRRLSLPLLAGLAILAVFVAFAVAPDVFAPYDPLAFDFGGFEDGGDQFAFAALDFGVLHFDFVLFFDLTNGDFVGLHLLQHDVRLNFVRLIRRRLLLLDQVQVFGLFDVEIALGFGLFRLRQSFGEYAFLIGLGFRDGGFAGCNGAPHRCIALGFRRGYIGIALDARDIRAARFSSMAKTFSRRPKVDSATSAARRSRWSSRSR